MTVPSFTEVWAHTGSPDGQVPLSRLLRLEERPVPEPGLGQAVIRVEAAPVNPSDVMFIRGTYGVQPKPGDVPGFEGCGTVVAANAGPYGTWLTGRRVSFGGQDGHGSWARYVVVSIFSCIPVRADLPVEAAATLVVNPMTAIGLLARARSHGTGAVVVTAAGSMLGRYLLSLVTARGGPEFIGLVRRAETAEALRRAGARHVLVTTDDGFVERFGDLCRELGATVLLDAVAGDGTAALMDAMPERTLTIVYGQLSPPRGSQGGLVTDTGSLVFRRHRIEGYWLTTELHGLKGVVTPLSRARRIQRHQAKGLFEVEVAEAADFGDLAAAAERSESGGLTGKVLFVADPSLLAQPVPVVAPTS